MIAGVDLAARDKNPTGICTDRCTTVRRDDEILDLVKGSEIIVVDAPLTLEVPWRDAERELLSMGYRPLPLSMTSMKELYRRANKLFGKRKGVVETFVSPMRYKIVDYLAKKMGWNRHERDAFLCKVVGLAIERGEYTVLGKKHKIYMANRDFIEKMAKKALKSAFPWET